MQFKFIGPRPCVNPPHTIIAVAPRQGQPGKVGFQFHLPTAPPLTYTVVFDRNTAEELLDNLRKALDTAKGLGIK